MALTKEDLELIDALVLVGAINRPAGHLVRLNARPGMIATYVMEQGYCNLANDGCYTVVDRLARSEFECESMKAACLAAGDELIALAAIEHWGAVAAANLAAAYSPETDR